MILKSEISPKTFEILKKVKSRTGFFGVADPFGYPEMRLVILDFADISINFYPKEGTEFTAIAPVFKGEVAKHITAARIVLKMWIFYIGKVNSSRREDAIIITDASVLVAN